MGDCLLLTSPVRALKKEFPEFRISVLVEDRFLGCFDGNPDFDEILSAGSKLQTARKLFRRRYDAIINLHGGTTSAIYCRLARGIRVGLEQYRYQRIYDHLAPAPESKVHTVQSTMALFQWLGLPAQNPPPLRYEVHEAERQRIRSSIKDTPYIVIHPGSVMNTKRWDVHNFAELAHSLRALGFTIVLTCGPGEQSVVGQVAKDIPSTTILLGLNIPELAELIRGARLYVGNDSGPMHLAAAVGTPTIAIWGSSDARRWRPWDVEHRVVQNPFECNPCPGYRCLVASTPLCIESVTVAQVNAAAKELLKATEK
jgi:heptosyltransferase-3